MKANLRKLVGVDTWMDEIATVVTVFATDRRRDWSCPKFLTLALDFHIQTIQVYNLNTRKFLYLRYLPLEECERLVVFIYGGICNLML